MTRQYSGWCESEGLTDLCKSFMIQDFKLHEYPNVPLHDPLFASVMSKQPQSSQTHERALFGGWGGQCVGGGVKLLVLSSSVTVACLDSLRLCTFHVQTTMELTILVSRYITRYQILLISCSRRFLLNSAIRQAHGEAHEFFDKVGNSFSHSLIVLLASVVKPTSFSVYQQHVRQPS